MNLAGFSILGAILAHKQMATAGFADVTSVVVMSKNLSVMDNIDCVVGIPVQDLLISLKCHAS